MPESVVNSQKVVINVKKGGGEVRLERREGVRAMEMIDY